MGYTTDFKGSFNLNKKLDTVLHGYLKRFSDTRRMKREPKTVRVTITRVRRAFYQTEFGGYGNDGEFFVDGTGCAGQDMDASVLDYNQPPGGQPGLWCQWVPSDDGLHIEWDGGEKFYEYERWLQYICDKFLAPRGYVLNGRVRYQGEDHDDAGWVVCSNNRVTIVRALSVPEDEYQGGGVFTPTTNPEPKPSKPRAKKPTASPVPKRVIDWQ